MQVKVEHYPCIGKLQVSRQEDGAPVSLWGDNERYASYGSAEMGERLRLVDQKRQPWTPPRHSLRTSAASNVRTLDRPGKKSQSVVPEV